VRVQIELLAPTMQYTEETNFRTQTSGVASDFEKGFGAGTKQDVVDGLLVLQHQRSQATRQGEDHMEIARGEQFSLTRSDPAFPCGRLTLRAVPISAANGELPISCIMGSFF